MGDFINKNVTVFVSTYAENFLKYEGFCVAEDDNTITLENTTIKAAASIKATKMFVGGESGLIFEENLTKVVINKNHIISCNEK